MTGPVGGRRPVLGRDGDNPVDQLIRAWTAWEAAPGAVWTAAAKEDALRALGLPGCATHRAISTARDPQGAALSVPDAVQTVINDTHHQEAA